MHALKSSQHLLLGIPYEERGALNTPAKCTMSSTGTNVDAARPHTSAAAASSLYATHTPFDQRPESLTKAPTRTGLLVPKATDRVPAADRDVACSFGWWLVQICS
jgi:hypothetical protein